MEQMHRWNAFLIFVMQQLELGLVVAEDSAEKRVVRATTRGVRGWTYAGGLISRWQR
jgi:hypothetical protein